MTTRLLDQNLSCRSLDMETFGGDCKVFDGNLYSESLALDTFPWFVLFANGYVDQDVLVTWKLSEEIVKCLMVICIQKV